MTNIEPGSRVVRMTAPTNKAVAATGGSAFGAAVSTIVLWAIESGLGEIPDNVEAAFITIITALVTLAAAYFTPPGSGETVVVDENGRAFTARVN